MIGRNEDCHCGSGKKHKKCSLEINEQKENNELKSIWQDSQPENSIRKEINYNHSGIIEESEDCDGECDSCDYCDNGLDNADFGSNEINFPTSLQRHYNQNLTKEENDILDTWYSTLPQPMSYSDPDNLAKKILQFLHAQPRLFPHLYLEDEILFEIGDEFGRQKEWSKYTELLKEIRQHSPEMYKNAFEYFEFQLIVDTYGQGKPELTTHYFDFFTKEAIQNHDIIIEIANFLAWTNQEKALLEFMDITAEKCSFLPSEITECESLYWPIFKVLTDGYDALDPPEVITDNIFQLIKLRTRQRMCNNQKQFYLNIASAMQSKQSEWDISSCDDKDKLYLFYENLSTRFCVFLHECKNFGWVKARYCANRLFFYWIFIPRSMKLKHTFRMNEKRITQYINEYNKIFSYIDGVPSAALLEAIFHFADFLKVNNIIAEVSSSAICEAVKNIATNLFKTVDPLDPIARVKLDVPPFNLYDTVCF
jgi:hypothetical protein